MEIPIRKPVDLSKSDRAVLTNACGRSMFVGDYRSLNKKEQKAFLNEKLMSKRITE